MNYNSMNVRVNVSMNINGIGQRMKIARILCGKSTRKLAEAVGRHQRTIQRYEAGTVAFPDPGIILAIAGELDVSGYWMLSGIGRPSHDEDRNEAITGMLSSLAERTEPIVRAYQHTS